MNIREDKYIWILCNKPEMREKLREYLLTREDVLVIDSDYRRFYGKFATKAEKKEWREY